MPEVTRTPVRAGRGIHRAGQAADDRGRPAGIDEFVGELQVAQAQVAGDGLDQIVGIGEAVHQRIW